MFVRHAAAAVIALALIPGAAHAQYKAGSIHFELRSLRYSAAAIAKKNHYRHVRGCQVMPIRRARRALLRRAVAHADRVLRDRRFRQRVRWWRSTTGGTGADELLRRLLRTPITIYVTAFRRSGRHPCRTRLVDGHTNAFVPDVKPGRTSRTHLLFLARDYLDKQYFAPDPNKGVRNLARTLIHETLHIMGYSHAGRIPFSARYNRAVPVYLGCVVMNWRATNRWLVHNCHKASKRRAQRSPYRWLCYTRKSLRRHLGQRVNVTVKPNLATGRGRRRPAILLRVHTDDTATVRWQRSGRTERVGKCRLVV